MTGGQRSEKIWSLAGTVRPLGGNRRLQRIHQAKRDSHSIRYFVAALFAVLGITQYLHDEKKIIGRTLMGIIMGTAVAAVIVVTVFVFSKL